MTTPTLEALKAKSRIEIPEEKLGDLIRHTYALSRPVGMGMLHFMPGPIPEETVTTILNNKYGVSMDYVHGRQCKMSVGQEDGKYFISRRWPDHSKGDLVELLTRLDIPVPEDL